MMLLKKLLFATGLFCYVPVLFSQVGINTAAPDAQLEIRSSNQAAPASIDGILIPKIDVFPATNPTAAQQSMMVYLTTVSGGSPPGFYYWDNSTTSWIGLATGKNWDLLGNAATNPATHFIGTTDNQPFSIRTNNTERLRVDANGNIGISTVSPQAKFHLFSGASGLTPNVFSPAVIEGNGFTYLNVLSNSETGLLFGSGGTSTNGGIVYNSGIYTNGMNFRTGGNQNRMSISSAGQVSIGNALANARLQILSSNQATPANTDGIIIPKVDAFPVTNPTASQQSMLVYLTTTAGTNQPGFYYWDNPTASWIGIVSAANSDADWYEEGTTKSPNAITDDMFHLGKVAIGKNTTNYPLEVDNTAYDHAIAVTTNYAGVASAFGISNVMTGAGTTQQNALINSINNSGNGSHMGVQNTLSGSGTGFHYGVLNNIVGTGNGGQVGMSTNLSNTGTGAHFGVTNVLSGTGIGNQFGVSNTIINSGNGIQIGVSNNISNSGNGNHYGMASTLSGSGNGVHIGLSNQFNTSGSGDNIGVTNDFTKSGGGNVQGFKNLIVGSGNGAYYGVDTIITNNGSGPAYGSANQVFGTSTGSKNGYFAYIDPAAGGAHTGIYSEVLKPGGNNFAGFFLGNLGIGTAGANVYTMPPSRGTNDQIMQTDASGNVTWKDPNTALNNYAWGITGNSATNPATHFLGTTDSQPFAIRTDNTQRLVVGNTGNIGLGAFTPAYPLEFKSDLGDKISLWSGAGNHFGFGIQGSLLQVHTDVVGSDIAFGYGSSATMTENMRIQGNGKVGIGTPAPASKLHIFNGSSGLTPNAFSPVTIEGNGFTYLNILSNSETGVAFGSGGNNTNGGIIYNSGVYTNGMNFRTGGNQNRMSISSAGQVSIGNALANARLDVTASNQAVPANTDGIIIPKIDVFPATNPGAAQNGMMVFLTTAAGTNSVGFYYWDNAAVSWIAVGSKSSWSISGNSGMTPTTNFVGTNDNAALAVRTNGSERMRVTATGDVGIRTTTPTVELEVNGYTKLGTTAPGVKMLKLTGTTNAVQGVQTLMAHGLTSTKILSVAVFVEYTAGAGIPPNYTTNVGYEYEYFFNTTSVVVWPKAGNSANILSKPIRILVTYEE